MVDELYKHRGDPDPNEDLQILNGLDVYHSRSRLAIKPRHKAELDVPQQDTEATKRKLALIAVKRFRPRPS